MKKLKKDAVFFLIGGVGYGAIEILWRGHTHWSMLIAGGICFKGFSDIAQKFRKKPLVFKASLCALNVTAVELLFGIIFNLLLKQKVWDYSKLPFNFMGQICLLYSLMWGFLGLMFIPLAEKLNKKLS